MRIFNELQGKLIVSWIGQIWLQVKKLQPLYIRQKTRINIITYPLKLL